MKKLLLPLLALLLTAAFTACEESDPTAPETSIYGSWLREITDDNGNTFTAELRFNSDNSYDWLVHGDAPGHTDSHAEIALGDEQFTIVSDADCGGQGVYAFVISSNRLALVAVSDACAPRTAAIEGVWRKM